MKHFRRILICSVLLVILLAGMGYGVHHGYVSLRQARLLKQARQFIEQKQEKKAVLCLQRALRANVSDPEANRLLANLAEANRSPEALLFRTRVVEALPDSTDDHLALARTALALRDLTTASNALQSVSAAGKATPGYHNLAGAVAVTAGQKSEAEMHFKEAARLCPTNPAPHLNLAVIQLTNTNSNVVARARAALDKLSATPGVNCDALRELVKYALRTGRTNEALRLVDRLVQQTNAVFHDKLLQLDILRSAKTAELPSHIAAAQREANSDVQKAQAMGKWLLLKAGPADALRWMQSLVPEILTNQPLNLLAADCYTALNDWPTLQSTLEKQQWGNLEFLRHGFLSRAMRGQDLVSSAKAEWELALKAAKSQKAALTMLLQMALNWKYTTEAEQIFWTFCTQFPNEKWAPAALEQLLYVHGRSDALMRLYTQLNRANPNDLAIKNNLAMIALLLHAKQLKPHELAREVYEQAPTNASYTSTYAFSLYRQNKPAEALTVIEHLTPTDLEKPSIAGYYGVFLKAAGQPDKAQKYLERASKAGVLPEERKLFSQ